MLDTCRITAGAELNIKSDGGILLPVAQRHSTRSSEILSKRPSAMSRDGLGSVLHLCPYGARGTGHASQQPVHLDCIKRSTIQNLPDIPISRIPDTHTERLHNT